MFILLCFILKNRNQSAFAANLTKYVYFTRSANFQTNLTAKSLKTVKTSVLVNDNCFAWLEPFFDTPAS